VRNSIFGGPAKGECDNDKMPLSPKGSLTSPVGSFERVETYDVDEKDIKVTTVKSVDWSETFSFGEEDDNAASTASCSTRVSSPGVPQPTRPSCTTSKLFARTKGVAVGEDGRVHVTAKSSPTTLLLSLGVVEQEVALVVDGIIDSVEIIDAVARSTSQGDKEGCHGKQALSW
ncbi:hypothetical protein TrRE_jg4754, partial [Triparma retinervis]